ncbi:MAG: MFS transporter [Stappia sp.]|uniref:MFS transporter n=1 Tax=Stappia sp. TaxID=1870903 RepID=UPI000C5A9892|nr:MFS transporter [Stappia sp.]MAA99530.1 MFS transporter [Stappia sp.]MBM20142.1 MFS transporter [Stappia sp.]
MSPDAASPDDAVDTPPRRLDRPAMAVVLLIVAVFGLAQGLTYPLLSFILERQGLPAWLIGANAAMMACGLLVSAPLIPGLAARHGAARLALVAALSLAVLFAAVGLFQSVWIWFPLRFLMGLAINTLYIASETWVNQLSPDRIRGRMLGLYATALAAGFAAGPAILGITGTQSLAPFALCVAITLVCATLIATIRNRLPRFSAHDGGSLARVVPQIVFLMAVTATAAAFDQAILTILPVYGLAHGLDERAITTALAIMVVGNILFQVPIGAAADRHGPRRMMVLLCLLTILGAGLLPVLITSTLALWAMLFVWGSAAYGIYTIALMELGRRYSGAMLISGNAAFALMWGAGGFSGPALAGLAIDAVGTIGLPILLALTYGALLVATLLRRERSRPVAGEAGGTPQ